MLESLLRQTIPAKVRIFAKLTEHGEAYNFDRWNEDRAGSLCLYYWFPARIGVKRNKKRVPVSEVRAALRELRSTGVLTREAFQKACPVAESAGPCGFAVVGRILEALRVAIYSGRNGFNLIDADEATNLLESPK